ncbi:MAG: acyl-CoA dehydrogenase family protein [Syntrophobacteraceae bacterium]|nr:acyl-CoA dehydrogenase family protein [Syntrophobacteraceae bacterium]
MADKYKGGSFLLGETDPGSIFTLEDFADEHRMVANTISRFIADKVFPVMEDLDSKKEGMMRGLLVEAGELGLLGADIPEEYGGFEMDEICSTIIAEWVGGAGSYGVAHGGQVGIGSLPIVYFGSEEQKRKYLPVLATGEKIAAYALTEPGSGSDALSAKTKAVLSADGKYYVLNGAKQFITNAGMADVFIVYAKIDGDKFSAFIVDGDSVGLSTGAEEKKMGIKGSSTRSVYFDDVKVPAENLLFEIGRGHVVAFNILNIGRHKVSANALGCSKLALNLSAAYANERRQFNVPISEFGLIREKLARMAIRTYTAESMVYRTGGMLGAMLQSLDRSGPDGGRVAASGIEEYAVECSLGKVFSSESQAFVVDEGVQIHGGYGFISEYAIERLYRDARITRIFEGTNEINRTIIAITLIRRAKKGDLPLLPAIADLKSKLACGVPLRETEAGIVSAAKDICLFVLGTALDKAGDALLKNQEILGRLADIAIHAYAMESGLLRAQKAGKSGAHKAAMARAFIYESIGKIKTIATEILTALGGGAELAELLDQLEKLCLHVPIDLIALRREIAAKITEAGKYLA